MPTTDASILDLENVKTLLKDNDETYDSDWRILREALQNALDSFVRYDPGTGIYEYVSLDEDDEYRVKLKLDLVEGEVTVEDNGFGIPKDSHAALFRLGGSGKRASPANPYQKGSQGVGIKSVVFSSEKFEVSTNDGDEPWDARVDNWHNYENMTRPWEVTPTEGTLAERGTKISYKLHKAEDDLERFLTETVKQRYIENHDSEWNDDSGSFTHRPTGTAFTWTIMDALESYLLHETYVGCVYRSVLPGDGLTGSPSLAPIKLDIEIIAPAAGLSIDGFDCTDLSREDIVCKYPEPDFPIINRPVIDNWKTLVENNIERSNKGFHQVLDRAGCQELLGTFQFNAQYDNYSFVAPDADTLATHRNALDRINGMYLCLGNANIISQIGFKRSMLLSANGLITTVSINEKIKGELPRLQNCHIILDVNDTLGFGKNKPGRRMGSYYNFMKAIWANIRRTLNLICEASGGGNVIGFTNEQKRQLSGLKLKVMQEYFGRATIPRMEQDVVQAFTVFNGHRWNTNGSTWISLSTRTTVDALMVKGASSIVEGGVLQDENRVRVEFKKDLKGVQDAEEGGDQTFSQYDFAVYWGHSDAQQANFAAYPRRAWDDENTPHKNHIRVAWGEWRYEGKEGYPLYARWRARSSGGWGLGNQSHVYLVPLELIYNDLCRDAAEDYVKAHGDHSEEEVGAIEDIIGEAERLAAMEENPEDFFDLGQEE